MGEETREENREEVEGPGSGAEFVCVHHDRVC
jgi:hypothetical protein